MTDKAKLLIIDDEEIVLDSCIQILASGDYEISTANNGESGLKMLPDFRPDLVFVDLKMPGISGFEIRRPGGELLDSAREKHRG